ncbi:DUF6143 family protein [Clostridium cellulovorans]|uniref:Uncharacterized protein n=1 Tax=Clostridium cellulovorans (strain ATCC 35296 / DSM 3052 / OCM 3 / 743B) TaxID=573061 RepID=D9SU14_CLOC7|nr:DUF6143 family protein [Clostridium cellulovorans]ADL50852.1 hypothetical protein Clocel_1093 [Clostridium cellulovorans 743B]
MSNLKNTPGLTNLIPEITTIPYPLYLSLQGKYFVGSADNIAFGRGKSAWAGLINPRNSGVNLHLYVWTATNLGGPPLLAEIWFNAVPKGCPVESPLVTPANTTISPPPKPRVRLFSAGNVNGSPTGGVNAYDRLVPASSTVADEEDGKFIFPPGGSFIISLSAPSTPHTLTAGTVAFGWYEEKIDS